MAVMVAVVSLGARPAIAAAQATPALSLTAGRFTVSATAADERLARTMLAAAQARDTFPGLPRPAEPVRIDIAADAAQFRALVGPGAPEWGAAIAIPDERRIVMQGRRAGSDAGEPLAVLRHELAHLALHEAMGALPPRWFDEGYASVAAGEFTREQVFETSIGMVWRTLPSLDALEDGFLHGGVEAGWSYAMAYRIVSELEQLGGPAGLTNFFSYWKTTGSFEKAVRQAYGMTGDGFEKHWKQQTRKRYGALSVVTNISAALGLFAIILVPLFISRKRRDRRKLEAMRTADAAQEARERDSALQALLDSTMAPPDPLPLPAPAEPRYPLG
jgi:hypothetical protein